MSIFSCPSRFRAMSERAHFFTSVERGLVATEDLDARGLEVHAGCNVWCAPRGMLSRSDVVRKMAVFDAERDSYVVHAAGPDLADSLQIVLEWPWSPQHFRDWVSACDFLVLRVHPCAVAYATSTALKTWNEEAAELSDCSAPEALRHTRFSKHFNSLASQAPEPLGDGYEYVRGQTAHEAAALAGARGEAAPLLASLRATALAQRLGPSLPCLLDFLLQYCRGDGPLFSCAPAVLCLPVHTLTGALRSLTNTVAGSVYVLSAVPRLRAAYSQSIVRHLVHRCFCSLYLAESLHELSALPLELAAALQGLYADNYLSLKCFVPARGSCHVLPGLLGAREVLPLEKTVAEVWVRARAAVPWLEAAMAAPLRLTGSFLCWCRTDQPGEPPGDVDLFCAAADLEVCAAHVRTCMAAYGAACGASLEVTSPNASRAVFRLRGAPRMLPFQSNCDVFVNDINRVAQYHLPMVRACLWLEDGRPQLYLSTSAAIAWITMLNVDYHAFRGSKTPFEIITKRWLWNFNLCCSAEEAHLLCMHLRRNHPAEFDLAELLARPERLVLHDGAEDFVTCLSQKL